MATRWHLTVVALCMLLAASLANAAIYRWPTGEVIPGTEGIDPGPGVQLDHMELESAALYITDLTGANFEASDLTNAVLSGANLTNATLTDVILTGANLGQFGDWWPPANLTGANMDGAVVAGALFTSMTRYGFTQEQLYSTRSYQAKDLQGISLSDNDLTGWDFRGQNLTNAFLSFSTLTEANLREANLTGASLAGSTLTSANLTAAVVTGADFGGTVSHGFTQEQLHATASHGQKDLHGIGLGDNDLSDWDFSGHDLTGAFFSNSTLTNAALAEANLTNANLYSSTLAGTDLSNANLTYAMFQQSTLTDANLTGALVTGADFGRATSRGFTKEQLYSTASYQTKNLQRITLMLNDLSDWDFSGQDLTDVELNDSVLTNANLTESDLTNANLQLSTLTGADLTGAILKNTLLPFGDTLKSAVTDSTTVYNQWTVFPFGFDPFAAGLTMEPSPVGDFNANDVLDVADVDVLAERIRLGHVDSNGHWPDAMFDVNSNGSVGREDDRIWVKDLKNTWFGDANLDGEFNSSDMVQVFVAGKYEKKPIVNWGGEILNPVSWSEGDWNADGVFDSSDMVTAFADGGYEKGPRTDAVAVPEPCGWVLMLLGAAGLLNVRRG